MKVLANLKRFLGNALVVAVSGLLLGCGNSEGTVTLNKSQTAALVKLLGRYEGPAHSERIIGAMMTGVWTVTFFQDEGGDLKCKCTLRLHDEQNGWGSPTATTADVKLSAGSGNGEYSLRTEGQFSNSEPAWTISIDGISLTSAHAINTISLFDMASYEIKLQRR